MLQVPLDDKVLEVTTVWTAPQAPTVLQAPKVSAVLMVLMLMGEVTNFCHHYYSQNRISFAKTLIQN